LNRKDRAGFLSHNKMPYAIYFFMQGIKNEEPRPPAALLIVVKVKIS